MRDKIPTVQRRMQALLERRTLLEHRAMALRDRASTLGTQAWAAHQAWKEATATMEADDTSAYDKYRARCDQAHAREALEALVGTEETQRACGGEARPWLQGMR